MATRGLIKCSASGTPYCRRHVDTQAKASWYGPNFHGKRTSSGETYDMHGMTAAHKTLPIPAMVKVTNLDTGQQIIVRVNDRGPFHTGRVIDLSKAAAHKLGVIAKGTARVKVEAIGTANDSVANTSTSKDYRNRIYVQTGSFGDRLNADNMLARLRDDGFENIQIQALSVSGSKVHRVRVGPLNSPQKAESVYQRMQNLGYRGQRIITD
jgi:rare lipoprotein A